MRVCRAERGDLCTFHSYRHQVLLAPSTFMGTDSTTTCFFLRFRIVSPPALSLRSGAVVILTSASRSGGEVRITEAERPRRIHPGRRGCQAGIAARSARTGGAVLYGGCTAAVRVLRVLAMNTWRHLS